MGLTDRRRAIVLFGDSLTQRGWEPNGWGAALAHAYGRSCDVYNRGFGGYNTRWCRHMLPHLFPATESPLLVTVLLGTNDAALADVEPSAHVPLEEYAENLAAIVEHVKRRAARVVLISPPCMDEIGRMAHQRVKYGEKAAGRLDRTNANTARYAEAARTVAADANVPFVDLFAITRDAMAELEDASFGGMGDDGDSDDDGGSFSASVASPAAALAFPAHRSIFEDGIHFDARGQHAVFDAVMRTVGAFDDLRTALDPERLRPDWPWGPEMREGAASAWREKFAAHEDAARREERARRRELEWKGGVGLGRTWRDDAMACGLGLAIGAAVGVMAGRALATTRG